MRNKVFVIIYMIGTIIYGQTSITGVVLDSLSSEPLYGASISLVGTAFITSTDINGEYSLRGIPLGKYVLAAVYQGYKTSELTVNLDTPSTLECVINLLNDEELTVQGKEQAAVINRQINTSEVVNVIGRNKLQEMPDVSIAETIMRLPGVTLSNLGRAEDDNKILSIFRHYLGQVEEPTEIKLRGLSSKYTKVSIDGVGVSATAINDRGVDLSNYSQENFSSIEIFKTITSDKDGDALSGTVNLITRKAPSKRLLRLEPVGNYNGLDKTANQYGFRGRYGERFFEGRLGVQIKGSIEKTIGSNELLDIDYDQTLDNSTDYKISTFEVNYINQENEKKSISLLLDYDLAGNGSIKLNNYYSKRITDYNAYHRSFNQSFSNYHYRESDISAKTYNSILAGKHKLLGFNADWSISFSESKINNPFDYAISFLEYTYLYESPNNNRIITGDGMQEIPLEYSKGPVKEWIPYAINNFEKANFFSGIDRTIRRYHKENSISFNFSKQYLISGNIIGDVKFGGKYRVSKRTYNEYEEYTGYHNYSFSQYEFIKLANDSLVKKDFTGTRFDGFVGTRLIPLTYFIDERPGERNVHNKYRLNPYINWDALKLWRQLNIDGYRLPPIDNYTEFWLLDEYVRNDEKRSHSYSLTEGILAGYIMNTLNFGQSASLTAGIRIETENSNYTGPFTPTFLRSYPFFSFGEIQEINSNYRETAILPNIHFLLKPSDFLNIKVAAYKTLIRPDYNNRLPKFILIGSFFDAQSSFPNYLNIGNTELKNAKVWNYELQTQYHGKDIGLFSINAFYKEIEGMHKSLYGIPIASSAVLDTLGVNWRDYKSFLSKPSPIFEYHLSWQYNSTKPTRVYGLEIEHQANFRYLPGLLKNIVLNYNFTLLRSETWVKKSKKVSILRLPLPPQTKDVLVEEKQKMEEQPDFLANVILGYDIKGFSFRASLFYTGEYDGYYSADQRSDIIVNDFTKLDISLKQRIEDYLTVYVNVNNVTNAKRRTSYANRVQEWRLENQTYVYGRTIDLGLRLDL